MKEFVEVVELCERRAMSCGTLVEIAAVSVNDGLFAVGVARSNQNCASFEHGISPCSETVAAESDSPMTIIAFSLPKN